MYVRCINSAVDSINAHTVPIKLTCSCRQDRLGKSCAAAAVRAGQCQCHYLCRAGLVVATDQEAKW